MTQSSSQAKKPALCVSDLPKATSTPRGAQPVVDTGARQNGDHDDKDSNDGEAKRFSTSSELTQISTTDSSSNGDDLENELIDQAVLNKNLKRHISEQSQKSISLSDVESEDASSAGSRKGDSNEAAFSFLPPPVPTSSPPSLDADEIKSSKWNPEPVGTLASDVILRYYWHSKLRLR